VPITAVAVVTMVLDVSLVGRTGATPVAVVRPVAVRLVAVVVEPRGKPHDSEAQTRSMGQHPPPRVAGQAWKLGEQTSVVCRPVYVSVVVDTGITALTIVLVLIDGGAVTPVKVWVTTTVTRSVGFITPILNVRF